MKRIHAMLISVVLALQVLLWFLIVRWQNTSLDTVAYVLALAALLVPFMCFLAIIYRAPLFADVSGVPRTAIVTILSIGVTFGTNLGIPLVLGLVFGLPVRG